MSTEPEAPTDQGDSEDEPRGSFTTRRPVAIGVVFLAAVVFGALSYLRLPVTLMPDISYPTLTVRTEYPGAAPEEVENDISRPIEEALGVINGLRRISSISRADVSDVVLELSWDTDMSEAVQDTLEKLDLVFLPDEAERPLILRFDPSLDPVMELSLSGEGERFEGEAGLRRLRRIAELQVKRALEPVAASPPCRSGEGSRRRSTSPSTRNPSGGPASRSSGSSIGCARRTSTLPAAPSRKGVPNTWCAP